MIKRPKFTAANFAQVVHNPKGKYLFGELIVDHAQPECETVPAGNRMCVLARKGSQALVMFPHDAVSAPDKVWSAGEMRLVEWCNIKVLGRFDRKQFQGVKK